MLNVKELAVLQVAKQPMGNPRIVRKINNMYNNQIEERKGRIITQAIARIVTNNAQSIANNNWIDVERAVINDINTQLLLAECNKQADDRNKVVDIFAKVANSDKNELLEEIDELQQQEETKEARVAPKHVFKQLFSRELTFKAILVLPEVKVKYDECVGLLPEKSRQDFYNMLLKQCCKGDITKDTVLAEIRKLKEKMDKIQQKNLLVSNKQNLSSSFSDGKESFEDFDELKNDIKAHTTKNFPSGVLKGISSKVSNANHRLTSQKQQSNRRGGR